MRHYSAEEVRDIRSALKKDFTYWYHKVDLGQGIITPGFDYEPIWNNIRAVRDKWINYRGKRVLDIAAFDGMFSFEAENKGAKEVIATDCLYRSFRNFLFCKEILGSKCMPYFNVSSYNLFERLDVYFEENYDNEKRYDRLFDVIQHLGLFYHLRDPLQSLSQARSCMKTGGQLLFETYAIANSKDSMMVYNGIPHTYRLSENVSVWWMPTIKCVNEMLRASFFEPVEKSIRTVHYDMPLLSKKTKLKKQSAWHKGEQKYEIVKLCMVAKAVPPKKTDSNFARELLRTYRNPGMEIEVVNKY
ncbi:MAG TPA: DUF1698 domain-containing protein [Candidatus Paceibacterota bacterium]